MSRTFKDLPHDVAVEKLRRNGKAEEVDWLINGKFTFNKKHYSIVVPSSDVENVSVIEDYLLKVSESGFSSKLFEHKISFVKEEVFGYPRIVGGPKLVADVYEKLPFRSLIDLIQPTYRPFWNISEVSENKPLYNSYYDDDDSYGSYGNPNGEPKRDLFTVFKITVTNVLKSSVRTKTRFNHSEGKKYGLLKTYSYWRDGDSYRWKIKNDKISEASEILEGFEEDFENSENSRTQEDFDIVEELSADGDYVNNDLRSYVDSFEDSVLVWTSESGH